MDLDVDCAVWRIFTVRFPIMNVLHGTCMNMQRRRPSIIPAKKAAQLAATYEEFQAQMKQSQSAVVLVSSMYDDTFWQDTPGHYVNIWLYQEDTDMVFLAEPGNPEKNRTWVPLRYIYDALKMVSPYQYLSVAFYAEEANMWKWNGITDNWNGR